MMKMALCGVLSGYTNSETVLVDEVADVGEDAVTQIDAQQPGTERGSEVLLEILENVSGEICLSPKQAEQGRAVSGALVVAG